MNPNSRKPGESFEDYRKRRAAANFFVKRYLKGKTPRDGREHRWLKEIFK